MSSRWGLATFALTAGCGFQISATGDGAVPPIDAPPKVVCTDNQCRLRIDSEVDFLGAATMLDVAVEPDTASPADPTRAVLTPAAYIRGAVIARGANAVHGSVGTGIDWAGIDAATVEPKGAGQENHHQGIRGGGHPAGGFDVGGVYRPDRRAHPREQLPGRGRRRGAKAGQ